MMSNELAVNLLDFLGQILTNCKRPKKAFPQVLIRFIDWETLAKNKYTKHTKLEWDFLANTTTQTNYTVKLI